MSPRREVLGALPVVKRPSMPVPEGQTRLVYSGPVSSTPSEGSASGTVPGDQVALVPTAMAETLLQGADWSRPDNDTIEGATP